MATTSGISSSSIPLISDYHCPGRHKRRLLIGEGNFSFAEALVKKHDMKAGHDKTHSLALSIIATELKSDISCKDCALMQTLRALSLEGQPSVTQEEHCQECLSIIQRIGSLRGMGMEVILGFDGTEIAQRCPGKRFERIHWNVPHDGKNITGQTMPPLMDKFFKACSKVQVMGDRVHITIPCPPAHRRPFYQGYVYDITKASSLSGYKLIKKRKFELSRYPEYKHVRTNLNEKADVVDKGAREFIFQKIDRMQFDNLVKKVAKSENTVTALTKELTKLSAKKSNIKRKTFFQQQPAIAQQRSYHSCSSDEDSSDYAVSDSEKNNW